METKIYVAVRIACTIFIFYHLWMFLFCRKIYGLWDNLYYLARIARIKLWSYRKKRMQEKTRSAARRARRNKELRAEQLPQTPPSAKEQPPVVPEVNPGEEPKAGENPLPAKSSDGVIGKSKFVYLEDPEVARNTPVRTEPLEKSGFIGEEEDIDPDDVEDDFIPGQDEGKGLTQEEKRELMAPVDSEPDADFNTAMTYEEMNNVAEVLMSDSPDERKAIRAAGTIYHKLNETDILQFLVDKLSNQDKIDRLLGECLDEGGRPLPKRKTIPKGKEPFNINKYA